MPSRPVVSLWGKRERWLCRRCHFGRPLLLTQDAHRNKNENEKTRTRARGTLKLGLRSSLVEDERLEIQLDVKNSAAYGLDVQAEDKDRQVAEAWQVAGPEALVVPMDPVQGSTTLVWRGANKKTYTR